MTATAVRTSQALTEWTKIFPKQVTESYTSSATFMKQLSVIAVSTITYLKGAFPEDNYTEDSFGGLKIRVLKNKCTDDLAQFLITALTHAFEAFDKKYLHQIALCFYAVNFEVENLIEYHILEFAYMEEGVALSISSKSKGQEGGSVKCTMNDIRDRTVQLLRACMVMMTSHNQLLPENYNISLRLYYNEDAPEGYQAPGFMTTRHTEDPIGTTFDQAIKLGWVQTPFHRLTTRTYLKDQIEVSREAIPSQNPPQITQATELDPGSDRSSPTGCVRCSCNNVDSDDQMLTCQYCKTQQHAACYGLTPSPAARLTQHCCVVCADADASRRPTDANLAAAGNRVCYAIFRRALRMCSRADSVCAREFCLRFNLSMVSASRLMKLLHTQGVIRQGPNSDLITPITILHDHINPVMKKYFRIDEEDIVNRLVEETFASREAPDPVGDVLSPLEKVSLQNASNIGRVIEPEINNNNNAEDPTLKQYREALVMEKLDDLPFMSSQESLKEFESKATKRKAGKENKNIGVANKRAKRSRK